MRLRLHVNYRQLFQGRRGWGRGSLSVYSTRMNGTDLAKKLYPDIFLLSPRETEEEAWSRVTARKKTTKKKTPHHTQHPHRELKKGFNYTPNDVCVLFLCDIISGFLRRRERSCPIILWNRAQDLLFFKWQMFWSLAVTPPLRTLMMVFRGARRRSPRLRERLGDRNVQTEEDGGWIQTDTKNISALFSQFSVNSWDCRQVYDMNH